MVVSEEMNVNECAATGSRPIEDMVDSILKEFQVPMYGGYRLLREIILHMYEDASLSVRDAECLLAKKFGMASHQVHYAVYSTIKSADASNVPEFKNGKLTPKRFLSYCICKLPPHYS